MINAMCPLIKSHPVLWLVLLFLVLPSASYGQQNFQLAGYIIDQETGEPVPYASVGIIEQQKGISANINGYFRLLLNENNPQHHLQISSIGYQRKILPLSEIAWGSEQQFYLVPELKILDEIVIVGNVQSPEDLLKAASKNRKVYLRSDPYLMNGFYREVLKVDSEYQGLTEAQGILFMNGYDPRYKNDRHHLTYDLVQWKHIRRSDYPQDQQRYLEVAALLKAKDYYLHNGPLQNKNLDRLTYTVTDSTSYQDHLVLEISFESPEFSGKMYIKEDDQALLQLELEATGPEPFLRRSESEHQISSKFQISFLLFEGQYYLGHCSFSRSLTEGTKRIDWYTELFGATFSDQKAMFLNYNQRLVLFSEMLNPMVNYDPEFWKEFSFALNSSYSGLSEGQDLENQFESHHNQRLIPLPEGFENYEQMVNDRGALDLLMER